MRATADAVHGGSIMAMVSSLAAAGAVPVVIAPRLGRVKTADRKPLEASGTLENSAPVLFDALVLPDGVDGVADLARYDQTMDFIRDQYRHGKTILALGASKVLLVSAEVSTTLPSGESDPGILLASASKAVAAAFVAAVGKHRHTEREAALVRS
jgi:catalase